MNDGSPVASLGKMDASPVSNLNHSPIVFGGLMSAIIRKRRPRRRSSSLNSQSCSTSKRADDTELEVFDESERPSTYSAPEAAAEECPTHEQRMKNRLCQRSRVGVEETYVDSEAILDSNVSTQIVPPASLVSSSQHSSRSSSRALAHKHVHKRVSDESLNGRVVHSTRPVLESPEEPSCTFPKSHRASFIEPPVRTSVAREGSLDELPPTGIAMHYAMEFLAELDPEAEVLEDTPGAPIPHQRNTTYCPMSFSPEHFLREPRYDRSTRFSESYGSIFHQLTPTSRGTPPSWKLTPLPFRTPKESLALESSPNVVLTPVCLSEPRQFSISVTRPLTSSTRSESTTAMRSGPVPVTLLSSGALQRKKHVKRVSCYVLGPLFGEGAYGVVRDAIDTSANRMIPPHFQRVAIKSFKQRRKSAVFQMDLSQMIGGTASKVLFPSSKHQMQDAKVQHFSHAEMSNLQRFHCPTIIRAIDIFTRYGKDYVVLPIAVCNINQLIEEAKRCEERGTNEPPIGSTAKASNVETTTPDAKPLVTPRAATGNTATENPLTMEAKLSSMVLSNDDGDFVENSRELQSKEDNSGAAALPKKNQGNADARTSPCSAALVKGIIYQVLYGLVYLHRQGLAHNDIKPHNILLFDDGLLKVSDLGSVGEDYKDGGTPMYTSPEVCRYYYHADGGSESTRSNSSVTSNGGEDDEGDVNGKSTKEKTEHSTRVDAQKNDMWGCGMILYHIMTGQHLWCPKGFSNRFQLYRRIALQRMRGPVPLDSVPEPRDDELPVHALWTHAPSSSTSSGDDKETESSTFPATSLRHLLSGLLAIDPAARLTSEEALRHPALHSELPTSMDELATNTKNALLDGAKADVASRTLHSSLLRTFIQRDRERHLQFVAECCYVLGIPMPPEIFLSETLTKTAADQGDDTHKASNGDTEAIINSTPTRGTVDATLFPSEEDQSYYERKLGAQEFDVRFILKNAAKVALMQDYLYNSVLVDCGYLAPDAAQETRVRKAESSQRLLEAKVAAVGNPKSGSGGRKKEKKRKAKEKGESGSAQGKSGRFRSGNGLVNKTGRSKCLCIVM